MYRLTSKWFVSFKSSVSEKQFSKIPVHNFSLKAWTDETAYRTSRWEDNIKVVAGCESVDWIQLAGDRNQLRAVVNTAMNLRGSIKCDP